MNVLIIDDERNVLNTTSIAVETAGHNAYTAFNTEQADRQLAEEDIEAILLDRMLGKEDGLDYLERLNANGNTRPVIIFTAHSSIESAVESMRRGAYTYVQKPFVPEQIRLLLNQLSKDRSRSKKLKQLETDVSSSRPNLILESKNPTAQQAYEIAFKAAQSDASILLLGESGTGKSILAREIHERSLRHEEALVTVSCPSLSRELLESELFGHTKGAFTGAVKDSWGKVHAADGGSLFLDEIGEMPIEIQPKLLRLLQEQQYERLGETKTRTANIRVISATNRDIYEEVANGNFREDLLYRLNVIAVTLPSLRERQEDLEEIATRFLAYFSMRQAQKQMHFSDAAMAAIKEYHWPGNLREMNNVIERAVILSNSEELQPKDLMLETPKNGSTPVAANGSSQSVGDKVSINDLMEAHIRKVLENTSNLDEAAKTLGIDTATLYRKRKKMGLLK